METCVTLVCHQSVLRFGGKQSVYGSGAVNMNLKIRGTGYSILSAVIFGCNPLIARIVYANGGNAILLAFYRMAIGAVLGIVLHKLFERGPILASSKTLVKLLVCASGFAITPILLFSSYNYLGSGMATTIHFVYPVLVILGCVIFYREAISKLKLICVVLCSAGILLLYTPGGGVSLFGIVLAFCSGITYAFYAVYLAKSGLQELTTFQLMFWLNLFGTVYTGIFTIAGHTFTTDITPLGWGMILLFGLLNSGIAVTFFQLGAKYIGPQKASLFSTFEPLTSVLIGITVYKEAITLRILCGLISILAAVILLAVGKENKNASISE